MDLIKWFIPQEQEPPKQLFQDLKKNQKSIYKPSPSTTKQVHYNYPRIFSTKLQPSYTGYIHYSLPGKENEPNLTIGSNKFVSSELYIFSKIHQNLPDMDPFDGELVLTHTPLTNGDKPLYMCFPLKTDASASKNILYQLLSSDDDEDAQKNAEIDLNPILPLDSFAYYYETPYSTIIVAKSAIPVPASFVGFNRGKLDDLWSPPEKISISHLSGNRVDTKFSVSFPSFAPPIREGMSDQGQMCDASYCYFDCTFSDVDFQNETPTYMISAGSDVISHKEKALNYAVTIVWLIAVAILTAFLGPLLFSIIGTRKIGKRAADDDENITILDRIEGGLGQLMLIPGIILVSVGVPKSLKCPKDDDACSKDANSLIMPGTILLSLWVFYAASLFFNKILNPKFLGFRDPTNEGTFFFEYKKNQIHLTQHFYPISLLWLFLYLFGWE